MKRLSATDFATLSKGGVIYDKTNPVLKPDFDQMWKRVTAFSKHVFGLITGLDRPFPYEIGKSRNYLQQAGRGKFYYPRFAWVRYLKEGEKRNSPSVSMFLLPEGITFSLDFAEKYEKAGNVSRDDFTATVEAHAETLNEAGYIRDPSVDWPRFAFSYSVESLARMSDSAFDERALQHLQILLSIYEAMMGTGVIGKGAAADPAEAPSAAIRPTTVTRRRRTSTPEPAHPESDGAGAEAGPATHDAPDVAAAALAAVRGDRVPAMTAGGTASTGSSTSMPTIVRRRRVMFPEEETRGRSSGGRSRAPESRPPDPRSELRPGPHPDRRKAERRDRPARTTRSAPVPQPRPIPQPTEQVSVVPPAVSKWVRGLEPWKDSKAMLLTGDARTNIYGVAFQAVAALVRDQLAKPKRRHELLLDALNEDELVDVIALALFEAPRGLSAIALQTHELVLHYYRGSGPHLRSLRAAIRTALQTHAAGRASEGLFSRQPNGSWALTPGGKLHVDENFRYALQEAAKQKPRRYAIDDYATFLHRDRGGFPLLYEVHERRADASGTVRSVVLEGPILRAVRRAQRDPRRPHALVLLGAHPEDLREAFGPLLPLIHRENRGTGALAPSIYLPDLGPISIPPNLHVVVGLEPGLSLDSNLEARLAHGFVMLDAGQIGEELDASREPDEERAPAGRPEAEKSEKPAAENSAGASPEASPGAVA